MRPSGGTWRVGAGAYGVERAFLDVDGRVRTASADSLASVLRLLGRPGERSLPEYVVAWAGRLPPCIRTRYPQARVELESGESIPLCSSEAKPGGIIILPFGYHYLCVDVGPQEERCRLVSAPYRTHEPYPRGDRRACGGEAGGWGVFAPTYALTGPHDRGVGTLGELASLGSWVAERGGCFVATTPLLAAFLEEPFEPSPYLPVTRLFWNELYADLPPSAASVPNTGDRVDYRQAFKTAREAARRGAACFFSSGSPEERARLAAYVEEKPEVLDYAHFRARVDREGCDWRRWRGEGVAHAEQAGTAARLKAVRSMLAEPSAATEKGDVDECEQVYLWWQWVTDSHLHALGSREDFSLSLDFPLGVHPGGFDTWRHPECFVGGASVGAPPDTFFREGQDWATPPLHPGALAGAGLDYLAGCLRTHMRVAGKLRIDHVMGLHRQYWIPDGAPATQGVYVNYPADLLYAVVALESMRAGCVVVGEDLGTVPPLVRPAMRRHGVRRTFVLQLEVPAPALRRSLAAASIALPAPAEAPTLRTGPGRVEAGDPRPSPDLPRPPKLATAMLNTHDLPPFAAYMRGDGGDDVHAGAEASLFAQLRAALLYLAGSEAEDVQINLEDLWLETDPQNTPGRTDAGLNWQRRVRLSLDELAAADGIRRLLGEVSRARASDSG